MIVIIFLNPLFAQLQITCDSVKVAKVPLAEINYVKCIEKRVNAKIEACQVNLRNDKLVATTIHPFVESVHNA